jgi:hypothetical protein
MHLLMIIKRSTFQGTGLCFKRYTYPWQGAMPDFPTNDFGMATFHPRPFAQPSSFPVAPQQAIDEFRWTEAARLPPR